MPYYGSDEYDYDRPGFHSHHATYYADPGRRRRSHSRAVSPGPPVVNIYNDTYADANVRNDPQFRAQQQQPQYAPAPPPPPPQAQYQPQYAPPYAAQYAPPPPVAVPVPVYYEKPHHHRRSSSSGSRGRRHSRVRDHLADDLAEMALLDQIRSKSRTRPAETPFKETSAYYQYQMEQKEHEIEEARRKAAWERENELKRFKDAKEKDEQKAHEAQMIKDYEEKKRADAEKAKKAEQDFREKMAREEREAKEKKEAARQQFLREEKEKKEKEEAEKKKEKERVELAMRRRLEDAGFSQAQIDILVDEGKAKKLKEGNNRTTITETNSLTLHGGGRAPIYAKIHRDYLATETLKYYDIPYEKDPADPDYIIVLREMDKYETELLFTHTRRLRAGQLTIEGSKKEDKQYAWYRKRDRSKSRVRQVGILEFK